MSNVVDMWSRNKQEETEEKETSPVISSWIEEARARKQKELNQRKANNAGVIRSLGVSRKGKKK